MASTRSGRTSFRRRWQPTQPAFEWLLEALWRTSPTIRAPCPDGGVPNYFRYWLTVHAEQIGLHPALVPPTDAGWETREASALFPGTPPGVAALDFVLWAARTDLQRAFDLTLPDGRAGLQDWSRRTVDREYPGLLARLRRGPPRLPSTRLEPPRVAVTLVGHADATQGIREDLKMSRRALNAVGITHEVVLLDGPEPLPRQATGRLVLLHINPDETPRTWARLGPHFAVGRRVVGYWLCELEALPRELRVAADFVDAVWVPSTFVANALDPLDDLPCQRVPYAVEAFPSSSVTRADLGLRPDEVVVTTCFDARSSIHRKNPVGAVLAFREAFGKRRGARLLIKAMELSGGDEALLGAAIDGDPRIEVLAERWSRSDFLALLGLSDIYLSLHRSEGFGRVPAEAMLLGKAIVATDYSGTRDFCRPEHAALVDYRLVPVRAGEYPFGDGSRWAEPDLAHAATWLRRLAADPELRQRFGSAARLQIQTRFNVEAAGRRVQDALAREMTQISEKKAPTVRRSSNPSRDSGKGGEETRRTRA